MSGNQTVEAFRAELRGWLEENCPQEMRDGGMSEDAICWGGTQWTFSSPAQKDWLERAAAKGYTVPTWPVEYGGAGLNREEEKVFHEEMARINARSPLQSFGIWMLGPALLHFGTHEQKLHYLPPIARGEIRWCQGYSEPGAGSDLASVQTKGADQGDHWLVNGQKIWTSYADKADWIFALIRTDTDAPKHKGISFLLIDMNDAGVETRPIKMISGISPFCETFFSDVKVPKHQIVGEENRGWDVAKYLLTHEREMISGGGAGLSGGGRALGAILAESAGEDGLTDATLRADAMRCEIDALAIGLTLERYKDQSEAGQGAGDASAMLKYMGTELNKQRHELLMNAGGSDALEWDGPLGNRAGDWLRTKANSIEGGTSEVMLSIVSRRVLGLPG
ncbi:acyl-CoA dehydrogenase family protein [Sulfitobacter mediterraneus]|jgi:alkylation response protein AidB-like acyl-CoA dehydrogenase|uniref:acyl-CoA dehydrogenase family protein n=3 Tax=Sulfitobacter mediterraneus TaxID=83219 RepID=UPI0019340CA6|nr:acyl-CoA dehydrogenase family protein [Sulfitobacter mediterraneus]MBM1312233.1 acyl-CoA dehydrogenase family protein [Sulfitobacter mediterraneus]MBM1316144.1 acyl-CoA dehydrogenase family protein [Sulfitobacter mediterraneus]MBM1324484.1 acyl-CoA dehydrogenase family protein [Sulfitobacter mediterraneus]MBM1328418.1 acyl-CoA dehydrogenase family protein [Sulfitobacter mediterraneus]MBM1399745.1 acyl-CoA dehydrogenase family protein [Sulfitobacter mediterraneus]